MKDLAGGGGGGGVHVTSTQSKICNSIKNADAGHKLCIHNKYYRSLNHSDSFYKSLLTRADHLIPGLIFFPGIYNT